MPDLMSMLTPDVREWVQFESQDKLEEYFGKSVDTQIAVEEAKCSIKISKAAKAKSKARMSEMMANATEDKLDYKEAQRVFSDADLEAFKDQQAARLKARLEKKGYTFTS